jgi:hypothetical protein
MSIMGKIDGDTRYIDGDSGQIDHAESAKENLKEVGQDLKKAILPDKIASSIRMIVDSHSDDSGYSGPLGAAQGLISLPAAVVVDAVEAAVMPLVAVKDAADAAVHGIIAGFKKVFHH